MIVRSLAIWISTLVMLALLAAPVYFQGKPIQGSTVLGALVLLAIAQSAQAFTLYLWTKPDLRKVIWNPETLVLTAVGFRVSKKFWSFGTSKSEFNLPLKEIREVTFESGPNSHLRFTTNLGFLRLTDELRDFQQLKDLMLELVKNPPVPTSGSDLSASV